MPKRHGWCRWNLNPGLSNYSLLGQSDQKPWITGQVADPDLNPLQSALLCRLGARSPRVDLASEEQVLPRDNHRGPGKAGLSRAQCS